MLMPFRCFFLTVLITLSFFHSRRFRRKWSIVLRTKLSVRVHACIGMLLMDLTDEMIVFSFFFFSDKLLNSDGRELRRSLFSLKQIFQDDKDLVHEFVNNQGLQCLVKIGGAADQNYQNYILRGKNFFEKFSSNDRFWFSALGQLMLYVDGMNAVMNQNEVVQWLYSLVESSVRQFFQIPTNHLFIFLS